MGPSFQFGKKGHWPSVHISFLLSHETFKFCTLMMTMGTSMGVIPLNRMVRFSSSYVGPGSTVSVGQPQF